MHLARESAGAQSCCVSDRCCWHPAHPRRSRRPALDTDLGHASAAELVAMREEPLFHAHSATGVDVDLGHPGADAVGVELVVPRAVERVGEVDPASVSAYLDHLWAAGEWHVRVRGVWRATDDPAEVHRADFARLGRIGDVVLLQLTGAPARDVEEAVINRQVDVADEWRNGPKRLECGWQEVSVGRFGGDRDDLVRPPLVAVLVPAEDRRGQVLGGGHHTCLLYTSPSPRDGLLSRMPSS